jgi:predicted negative regulator of RcsB-dependent stress response
VDRLTRHDLKTDKFVQEVSHTIEYVEEHRQQMYRWGGIALAILVVGGGLWFFMKQRGEQRTKDFNAALQIFNTPIGPADPVRRTFPTEDARQQAMTKAMNDFIVKHSGSSEAAMASYLLGLNAADQGRLPEAERFLKEAVNNGASDTSSLAKLALADVLAAEGKSADAEQTLRGLIGSPSGMVSKEQAAMNLARILAPTKPDEARKLLDPLRTQAGSVGQRALAMYSELGLSK